MIACSVLVLYMAIFRTILGILAFLVCFAFTLNCKSKTIFV